MPDNKNTTSVQKDVVTLREILEAIILNWKWFMGSVFIAIVIAVVYLYTTVPIFTRTTSVLIKDNSRGSTSSSQSVPDEFSSLGLFTSNTNIKSEIQVIQAIPLFEEVARRLKLNCRYTHKEGLRWMDLYKRTPISIIGDSAFQQASLQFEIDIISDSRARLSNFTPEEKMPEQCIEVIFGKEIETPFGKMAISKSPAFSAQDVGFAIQYVQGPIPAIAKAFGNSLKVQQDENGAPIISLTLTDEVPQRADDFLTTLIEVYNENWVKDKNEVTVNSSRFISERLTVIDQELGSIDKNISNFKSQNLMPDIPTATGIILTRANVNQTQLSSLNNQLSMANYIDSYLSSTTNYNKLIPANTGIENSSIESQIEKYNTLILQRNNLLTSSGANNPLIIDMNKSLSDMKDIIVRSVKDYVALLKIQIDNTTKEERNTKHTIAQNPTQTNYLLSVERQQKIKEELYLFLLQKREENELALSYAAYNTRIINPPYGDAAPTSPRKGFILLLATFIGFIVPGLFIYLRNLLNTSVHSRDDLKGLTTPIAGEIPYTQGVSRIPRHLFRKKKHNSNEVKIVVNSGNRDIINEAFRVLRTNIDFMLGTQKNGAVLMTTSIHPGSGKTFITSNFATSMALKGAKVVMIDCDLRRATLSSIQQSEKGLSDYLCGICTADEIIKHCREQEHLDIISVGTIPPNPSELLLNQRLEELILQLKTKYDYVFIDCPPVEIVTDASIVSKYCDMTLFVIRAGLMDRRLLPDVENIYQSNRFNKMCIILNGIEMGRHQYGYKRYGYYNYGKGYGEYYSSKKNK